MSGLESPAIARRVAEAEDAIGRRIVLRGTRHRNRKFRGRIAVRPTCVLVEYRDDTAGYFWHYQIIEELLDHLLQGRLNVVVYEGDIQYVYAPPQDSHDAWTPNE